MMFDKVIVWGFDKINHTHYYTHWGWYNGFKRLGYDTYWFSNENNPSNFDYENCLFISEGWVDQNIPIVKSSTYIIHICISPEKYIGRVKRLIDMRYLVDHIYDINYRYVLDKEKVGKISDTLYYEKLYDNSGVSKYSAEPEKMEYEAIYTCWASDLFPEEINLDDAYIERHRKIYWFGSANPHNCKELHLFATECKKNGIEFYINDPWSNPQSFEVVRSMTKLSFMAPDLRTSGDAGKIALGETGTMHKQIGYIACRLFKSISCGQLGITNSRHMYEILDKKAIYNPNESELFYDALKELKNYDLIKEQMQIVKEKHTFLKRVQDIVRFLEL
jgi:hypothetical protein